MQMKKEDTVDQNKSIFKEITILVKKLLMYFSYPEIIICIYSSILILIIIIVISCFYSTMKNNVNNEFKFLKLCTSVGIHVTIFVLKLASCYFYYIFVTEFKNSHLVFNILIRTIPVLLLIILYFISITFANKFSNDMKNINKPSLLKVGFSLLSVVELCCSVTSFHLYSLNIKSDVEILVLLIESAIEIIHIACILRLPQIVVFIVGYYSQYKNFSKNNRSHDFKTGSDCNNSQTELESILMKLDYTNLETDSINGDTCRRSLNNSECTEITIDKKSNNTISDSLSSLEEFKGNPHKTNKVLTVADIHYDNKDQKNINND